VILSGWGRYPTAECRLIDARGEAEVLKAVAANPSLIARGNGRAYGDCALNPDATLSLLKQDRLISFDPESGLLACEAGTLLSDIIEAFGHRGWFPPVTPGTKFVTVGGMIAADVHGKNHHRLGSFGDHVESIDLALADGGAARCSAKENSELFAATRGGMGLTGVILRASFRMIPIETAWIRQETLRAGNLDEAMALFEDSKDWTYSVAWIDCLSRGASLGRSIFFRGEHALLGELPESWRREPFAARSKRLWRVPFDLPGAVLNRWSVSAFNAVYFHANRPGSALVDLDTFFYPLDAIGDWNRVYGRAGLIQYQCVLPKPASRAGLGALLDRIAASGAGSFLSVLKLFGKQEKGLMSFPMEGYTLALDFHAGDASVLALLDELDAIVADLGGRIYLAKDARASAGVFAKGYPDLARFKSILAKADPKRRFVSLQSQRLGL
jgi:decaprenylphospho-beta-D-ribofuranose 2-oxidase